jgi:hypothetical protein
MRVHGDCRDFARRTLTPALNDVRVFCPRRPRRIQPTPRCVESNSYGYHPCTFHASIPHPHSAVDMGFTMDEALSACDELGSHSPVRSIVASCDDETSLQATSPGANVDSGFLASPMGPVRRMTDIMEAKVQTPSASVGSESDAGSASVTLLSDRPLWRPALRNE